MAATCGFSAAASTTHTLASAASEITVLIDAPPETYFRRRRGMAECGVQFREKCYFSGKGEATSFFWEDGPSRHWALSGSSRFQPPFHEATDLAVGTTAQIIGRFVFDVFEPAELARPFPGRQLPGSMGIKG